MRLPLPTRHRSMEDNILPLINVVFLLLIFFMLAGSLAQRPPFDLSPPMTSNAIGVDSRPGVLAVNADGQIALGGEVLNKAALRRRLAQRALNKPLQIKADADLPAARLADLLALARDVGIASVQLMTVREGS